MTPEQPVFHANMKDDNETKKNGLCCFLNGERECGADCMAYTDPPIVKGPDYIGKQWANCLLISSAVQTSKHVAVLAQELIQIRKTVPPPQVR